MAQQSFSQVSPLQPPARESNGETIVDTEFSSVLVQCQPDTQAYSSGTESIYSCLDCGEEFFYCEPFACDNCGGLEFEEVSA